MSVWDRNDPEEERRAERWENIELGLWIGGAIAFVLVFVWIIRWIVQRVN